MVSRCFYGNIVGMTLVIRAAANGNGQTWLVAANKSQGRCRRFCVQLGMLSDKSGSLCGFLKQIY